MAIQEPVPVLISVLMDPKVTFALDDPSPYVAITGDRQVTFYRSLDELSALFNVTFEIVTEGYQFGSPAILFPNSPVGIAPSDPTTVVMTNTNAVPPGDPAQSTQFWFQIDNSAANGPMVIDDPTIINNPEPPPSDDDDGDGR